MFQKLPDTEQLSLQTINEDRNQLRRELQAVRLNKNKYDDLKSN